MANRILLPNGCSMSTPSVSPSNWKSGGASLMKRDWRIQYYFYDPEISPYGKLKVVKGMNCYKKLVERRSSTKMIIDLTIETNRQGFNPITKTFFIPEDFENAELHPHLNFITAFEIVLPKIDCTDAHRYQIKAAIQRLKKVAAKLGYLQISISKLKRRHLKNMLEACKLPDNYFNKFRSYISRIFLELLEYECCDTNLVRDIRKKKIHKREREILSVDQMNLVMSYLKSNYYNFWRYSQIFLFSGGRTTEFFNLKAKNVDLEAQEFTVTIKKGAHYKEQTKVILKAVIPLWRELLKNAKPNDYVFSKGLMPGRIPLKANAITKRWYRVVKNSRKIIDAKGRPVAITADFYSLKHSFLDSLETDVAQLMASHTSSKTTIIYQVNKEKRDREELKKLEVSILKDV